jgi:2,3,4,5-tetrahydropyridine-2,6-dicarboxylate N-succinyltransferase
MNHQQLAAVIDAAWENRAAISPATMGEVRDAVDAALRALDDGQLRVATKNKGEVGPGSWTVHQWLKKAVLLSFRLNDNTAFRHEGGAFGWDKVPLKYAEWGENRFREAGFRAVPGAVARYSSFVARNAILMPSFVNVGAYVGESTMVDTWATVGSCAQIGANVHLSGGVGIGGVLEPLQANPTIIEDNCFIGARSESWARAASSRWASSSVPRRRSWTGQPARSTWATCRPTPSSFPAACRASRSRTARRDRRSTAR